MVISSIGKFFRKEAQKVVVQSLVLMIMMIGSGIVGALAFVASATGAPIFSSAGFICGSIDLGLASLGMFIEVGVMGEIRKVLDAQKDQPESSS